MQGSRTAPRLVGVLGGGALAVYGATRRSVPGLALMAVGGGAILRALGFRTTPGAPREGASASRPRPIRARAVVTVDAPASSLFSRWRDADALCRILSHVESIERLGGKRTRWTVAGPGGARVSWDAEEVEVLDDRRIAWKSLPGSDVEVDGEVTFTPAPGGRGTEVRVRLVYGPPGGALTGVVAALAGVEPGQTLREDLRRFKQLVEAGEIATTEGQPTGRPQRIEKGSVARRLADAAKVPSRRLGRAT